MSISLVRIANMHTPIFSAVVSDTTVLYEIPYEMIMILEIQLYKMITDNIKQ